MLSAKWEWDRVGLHKENDILVSQEICRGDPRELIRLRELLFLVREQFFIRGNYFKYLRECLKKKKKGNGLAFVPIFHHHDP